MDEMETKVARFLGLLKDPPPRKPPKKKRKVPRHQPSDRAPTTTGRRQGYTIENIEELRAEVERLRDVEGLTYAETARAMSGRISHTTVYKLYCGIHPCQSQ